jgi:predicted glycogen debranching enzyme
MSIVHAKINSGTLAHLEQHCYLTTNGLGGYSSLTLAGSATRNEHALFVAAIQNPTSRYTIVKRLLEELTVDNQCTLLSSQSFVNPSQQLDGFAPFDHFEQALLPTFNYRMQGLGLSKELVMPYLKNQLILRYRLRNPSAQSVSLRLSPYYDFRAKDSAAATPRERLSLTDNIVSNGQLKVQIYHNGTLQVLPQSEMGGDLFFAHDARDGRGATNHDQKLHTIEFSSSKTTDEWYVCFSLEADTSVNIEALFKAEEDRLMGIVQSSGARLPLSQQLACASDAYIIMKESLSEVSVIAGYPFFADWGRDSMIVSWGALLSTKRFDLMRNLLTSFARHEQRGLIPNLFDLKSGAGRYNTIDAALLLIISAYHYYRASEDLDFIKNEMLEVMHRIVEHYQKGTDYHIGMQSNFLIAGGKDTDQLTWMDVNFNGIVPTARHGFAVEINAMWYNVLCIVAEFDTLCNKDASPLKALSTKVKESFNAIFWSSSLGYLYDYVALDGVPNCQLRPNQVIALALPFELVCQEQAQSILGHVHNHLWTQQGLRTLSPQDADFKDKHEGSHFNRDMAYHQGTVWPFLSGFYGEALLRYCDKSSPMLQTFIKDILQIEYSLQEGCMGHVAEIYDGANPSISRGCFAQGWSVSEILRILLILERDNFI